MMEEYYIAWTIFILMFLAYAIIGGFVYFKKREKINAKEVWQFFQLIMLLRIFDILSTIYFVNKIGIAYEGNLIARTFMSSLGVIPGMVLIYIIYAPFLFFWFVLVNYIFNLPKRKIGWKIFTAIMIAVSIIVPLINISA